MIMQSIDIFSAKFPTLDSIIRRIKARKMRDMIILALVISLCIIAAFFIWRW